VYRPKARAFSFSFEKERTREYPPHPGGGMKDFGTPTIIYPIYI